MTQEQAEASIAKGCKRANCTLEWCKWEDEKTVEFQVRGEDDKSHLFRETLNRFSEANLLARRVYRGCMHYIKKEPPMHHNPFESI